MVAPGGSGGGSGTGGALSGGAAPGRRAGGNGTATLPGGSGLMAALARLLPVVVGVTGVVTLMMAFLLFGKRRRDQEPTASDEVLGAAAARGYGIVPGSGLIGSPARVAAVAPTTAPAMATATLAASAVQAAVAMAPGPGDMDAHLPRWRRPSLMEARKTDPLRSASTAAHLTFDGSVGTAVTGLERRWIRYRLVSLLSHPDEVRGMEIGTLDEGDQVVLLEKRGTFWRVLCPDGREGWVHKMVLGDVVSETPAANAGARGTGDEGPATGSFEDMLRAYSERRQQFGEA